MESIKQGEFSYMQTLEIWGIAEQSSSAVGIVICYRIIIIIERWKQQQILSVANRNKFKQNMIS